MKIRNMHTIIEEATVQNASLLDEAFGLGVKDGLEIAERICDWLTYEGRPEQVEYLERIGRTAIAKRMREFER